MSKIYSLILILLATLASAQTYQIDWYVIGSGGGTAESDNYRISGTIGQPIVGAASSENYTLESGFWVGAGSIPSCHQFVPGDANMINGQWPVLVIGADVTYLVNYFRGLQPACIVGGFYNAADANGDCLVIGSDVTKLVTYFRGLTTLSYCPDYTPCWLTPAETNSVPEPTGWPNCEIPILLRDEAPEADNTD